MKTIFFVLFLILLGCASDPTPEPPSPEVIAQKETLNSLMERGMKALEKEDFAEALNTFQQISLQFPASAKDLVVLYNTGLAHEGLGDCEKAAQFYRSVMRSSAGKFQRAEAEAAYRLSMTYDCLGDDKRAISALLDAKKRSKVLPNQVAKAELPARLASLYARVGQREKALHYFTEAGSGLKIALASSGTTAKIRQRFAAETLYYMGRLSPRQKNFQDSAEAFLNALSMQQPYLLQSAELGIAPPSDKAAQELSFVYENLLRLKPSESEALRSFLLLALKDIAEIKRIRMVGSGPLVEQIYQKIEVQESNLRTLLASQTESNPLTPDAQRREGLKRQGKVVGPSALEGKRKQ